MSVPLYDPDDERDIAARLGIQTHKRSIASLDVKLASLLHVVETLRAMKQDHEDQLRRCEGVLSLAGRLPTDILGCIFEHTVGAYSSAPLFLSQVCKAWRMATHGMPHLWSRIFVNCSEHWAPAKVTHWLSMSGDNVPLHITLFLSHNSSVIPVMFTLLRYAPRLKSLIVDAELPFHADDVLGFIRSHVGSLPILEMVDFKVQEELAGGMDFRATFDNTKCPRLHTISFQNSSWHLATYPSQITVLNLRLPNTWVFPQSIEQTLDLLQDIPMLQEFSLVSPDGSLPRGDHAPIGVFPITLSHLHTLVLIGCHTIFEILAHLFLPSLRHLVLRATGKEVHQTVNIGPSLLRMTERSSPPLKTLALYDIDASDEDFTRCFDALPELEELYLHESDVSNAVFRHICSPLPDKGWVCPQLKRLDLRWCSQLSGEVLVELVKSRVSATDTSRILEVVVINCSFVQEKDVFSLAALTVCRLDNRPEDFCFNRGCCTNNRYRHRFMLRHAAELRKRTNGEGRLEL